MRCGRVSTQKLEVKEDLKMETGLLASTVGGMGRKEFSSRSFVEWAGGRKGEAHLEFVLSPPYPREA